MVTPPENDQVTHPLHIARQGAKVGAVAAVPGLIIGSIAGTIRTTTPRVFALVSGAQWFTAGATFWIIRSAQLDHVGLRNWWALSRGAPLLPRPDATPTSSEKIRASAISGASTGAILGLLRGPRNVLPGMLMFTLFGYGGQHAYEWFDQRHTRKLRKQQAEAERGVEQLNWLQRFAEKPWSPMTVLTDEKYEDLLNEKLLKIEVEIALIDDKIKELRSMPTDLKEKSPEKTQNQDTK